ncbi:hypothetical protein [Microbacterium sp.]|uniref:hypothetical protein n=1 Tax=Microbacterium sp. TaxID=51671 RepID=UPI003341613D
MQSKRWRRIGAVAATAGVAVSIGLAAGIPANAADVATWMYSGKFQHVLDLTSSNEYLNDHTIIRDDSGKWHIFSIYGNLNGRQLGTGPASSENEDAIFHATAPSLTGSWTRQADALTTDPAYGNGQLGGGGEAHLWAPHVIKACTMPFSAAVQPCGGAYYQAKYYMFYAAGNQAGAGTDPSKAAINLATTTNLDGSWTRSTGGPLFRDGFEARDPFVTFANGKWYIFYTATANASGGANQVKFRTSTNLVNWSAPGVAFTDPTSTANAGAIEPLTESPVVVNRNGSWYLLIGPRGGGYTGTDVYKSSNIESFNVSQYAGHINAHAPEIVTDQNGKDWVTNSGWFQAGLDIAEVQWSTSPRPWQTPSALSVGKNADGRLEVFGVGAGGATVDNRFQKADGNWSGWNEGQSGAFGPGGAAATPTVVSNADGRLEVFAVDRTTNTIAHRWQTSPNGPWSAWDGNFGTTAAGASPVGALNADGRMEIFALAPGGASISHKWQQTPGGNWSNWEVIGPTAAGAPPVIAKAGNGKLQVVAVAPGYQSIAALSQTAPNSGWGSWQTIGTHPAGAAPVMVTTSNGTIVLAVVKPYGLGIALTTYKNGAWQGWDVSFGDGDGAAGLYTGSVSLVVDGNVVRAYATGPGTGANNPHNYIRTRTIDANGVPQGGWSIVANGKNAECAPSGGVGNDGQLHLFKEDNGGSGISEAKGGGGFVSGFGGANGGFPCGQPGTP